MTDIREMLGNDGEHKKIVRNILGEEKSYANKYEDRTKKFKINTLAKALKSHHDKTGEWLTADELRSQRRVENEEMFLTPADERKAEQIARQISGR